MSLARVKGARSFVPTFRLPCLSTGAALICPVRSLWGGVFVRGGGVVKGAR